MSDLNSLGKGLVQLGCAGMLAIPVLIFIVFVLAIIIGAFS